MRIEEQLYKELIDKMNTYHPTKEFDMIEKAYHLAVEAHKDQKRKSGEPYIIHPLKVAYILAELELDKESITAGILHDTIEDTPYTYEDIARLFNVEVANLVDGVTKLGKLSYSTKEEMQAENYRKMFLAMAKDIRVILIKLADRLHNMRTLNYMTEAKQREKAQETLDIYAPLAHRLGISKIRTEMEDLCFKYLNPDEYNDLKEKIEKKQVEREDFVKSIVSDLKQKMEHAGIKGKVEGRSKHFFSIYKKMVNQNKTLDQIYDLFAVRAIVDTVQDCYGVLGVVHTMYTPMPGRFKDYIAMPKPNMYQSLHNTLIGPEGEPFEVQIRTWEMHRTSEYGIAAHWKYKEGGKNNKNNKKGNTGNSEEAKLTWLRQILEWQQDMADNKEYLDTIKLDLNIFNDQVYAFTPQGKVINLPKGSITIDFAYMIHSAVGNKMVGARVNNKMVPIEYKIHNGDRIEILTSQNSKGPSRDWLTMVKSSQARTKINQWFKKEFKEENILKGKELLDKDIKKKNYTPSELLKTEWMNIVIHKFGFRDWDALCAAVGHGGVKEGQVTNRLIEELLREKKKEESQNTLLNALNQEVKLERHKSKSGVVVKGVGDVAVHFSKCCNPVPGDEIVGFVTRGRGVTIHRTDCINVMNLPEDDRQRLIEAEWDLEAKGMANVSYLASIRIVGTDRVGLMMEVSRVFNDEDVSVKSLTIKTVKATAIFDVAIEIKSKEQLERIIKKMMKLKDILEIERVAN